LAQAQRELSLHYPRAGWVEHDPERIWDSVNETIREVLAVTGASTQRLAAIGITNQRETTLIWDRESGSAITKAIVWQDRRTSEYCETRKEHEPWLAECTGLVLDPYFSATKLRWLLEHLEAQPGAVKPNPARLAAGTIDSWLVWHLTGGHAHVTDVTNASRTLLMDLRTGAWSDELCQFFEIPAEILPRIVPSSGVLAHTSGHPLLPDGIPICGIAGDQQASLVGQGCLTRNDAKCTYGTGAFLLIHTGERLVRSTQGLLTTAAAAIGQDPPQYALEGAIFIAGAAVQWFRDGLKAVGAAPEIDRLCLDANPDSSVIFITALTGLGSPHWHPDARGTIFGITRDTTVADLARATLEGVAFQVADLLDAIHADLREPLRTLRVDGGMAKSDPFLQFQADLLNIPLVRSPQVESTALGAALLAGLGVGLWPSREDAVARLEAAGQEFKPMPEHGSGWRTNELRRWKHAVETVKRHY
jgi:glycerol kinase